MRFNYLKATLKTAVLAVSVLLLGAGVAVAQVNLTGATSPSDRAQRSQDRACGRSRGLLVRVADAGLFPRMRESDRGATQPPAAGPSLIRPGPTIGISIATRAHVNAPAMSAQLPVRERCATSAARPD